VGERKKQEAAKVKAAGEKFLADNKTKPGIVALTNGLQYKIITAGKGSSPKAEDSVTVNYRGTLIDGTEFDSSYKRGQPATFRVGGVIPGWTQALQLMKPGAKWELFIPSELAYGENPPPNSGIGPNSTLVFEIELLSIATPPPTPPTPQPITSDIIRVPSAEEMKKGAKPEVIKADQIPQEQKK
jgi:FKBP-type peptidyl-prolyl cis-trans isomerase FklB